MNISIDRDRCEGHGLCAQAAPGIFALDADALAYVHPQELSADLADSAALAAGVCPRRAITIS